MEKPLKLCNSCSWQGGFRSVGNQEPDSNRAKFADKLSWSHDM